jgi:transcriptional regulator with XRE-family HTH domain
MLRLRVRAVAEEKGYSIQRLHETSGIAYPTILKYWHGTIRRIDIKTLDALATALQVDSVDLVEEVKE